MAEKITRGLSGWGDKPLKKEEGDTKKGKEERRAEPDSRASPFTIQILRITPKIKSTTKRGDFTRV